MRKAVLQSGGWEYDQYRCPCWIAACIDEFSGLASATSGIYRERSFAEENHLLKSIVCRSYSIPLILVASYIVEFLKLVDNIHFPAFLLMLYSIQWRTELVESKSHFQIRPQWSNNVNNEWQTRTI
jgi:hypothetical protein